MTRILKGKPVADAIDEQTLNRAELLAAEGWDPCLAILRVGEKPDDLAYQRQAEKKAKVVGVMTKIIDLPADATPQDVMQAVDRINGDEDVDGLLLLRPLPSTIDEDEIRNLVAPEKDVDGITDHSLAGVFGNSKIGYPPCTAEACMRILKHYQFDLTGKRAVVVGRSQVVGRPVAMMLLAKNATVTICHTKTENLPAEAQNADVLIVAAGQAGAIGEEHITEDQVIIDVGINVVEGQMVGDVDPEAGVQAGAITPVPGGVGGVTVSLLMEHVVDAAEKRKERSETRLLDWTGMIG